MLCVPMPILGLYSYVEIWAISTVDEYRGINLNCNINIYILVMWESDKSIYYMMWSDIKKPPEFGWFFVEPCFVLLIK